MSLPHFILYSRSYCHLCQDMEQALLLWQPQYPFSLEVREVDTDPQALAQYDELVPVLLGKYENQPLQQICHYFLDEKGLQSFFGQLGQRQDSMN